MNRAFLALAITVLGASRLQAQRDSIAMSDGATDWFGAGITAVRNDGAMLRTELRQAANAIALRIYPEGLVTVVGGSSVESGRHWLRLPRLDPPPAAATTSTSDTIENICHAPPMPNSGLPRSLGRSCTIVTMPGIWRIGPAGARRRGGYVLLVVSDSAFTVEEIQQRLATVRRFQLETVAHDLPEYLVGRRTAMWAGYLVQL